jgi:nucleoid-associated protein YgaU
VKAMDIKSILKALKLHESTVSMILGFVVIVVGGVLLVNYLSGRHGQIIPPLEIGDESNLPKTHTVGTGEDLWSISEKYYGTGYNWSDIAEANKLTNPNQIEVGQALTIPNVSPKATEAVSTPTIEPTQESKMTPTNTPAITPEAASTEASTYVVKKGENLWKIAEAVYGSGYNWVDIARDNSLTNANSISTGQELRLPKVEARKPTLSIVSAEPISGATYTVQKGDSLWTIAVRAYGDGYKWVEIAKENKLAHPGLIYTGNTLTLPR